MEPVLRNNSPSIILLSVNKWIHDHSPSIKISRIAFEILGATLSIASFIAFEAVSLPLLASGALILVITEIGYRAMSFFGFIAINRAEHVFTPATFRESRLYYKGDLPILEIKQSDPFQAGYDHGHLMAPYIFSMLSHHRVCSRVLGLFHFSEVKANLETIKRYIPEAYLKELEGLVNGMNDRDKKYSITLDEILLFHLVPDMAHLTLSNVPLVACSIIAYKNIIGRLLDWPSFGIYGKNTLLILKENTLSISVPGFLWGLTVINKSGLFAAINVCSPKIRIAHFEPNGIPGTLLVKYIADTYSSVEVIQDDKPTLVPFHLTVADKTTTKTFHFKQSEASSPNTVHRTMKKDSYFATFNAHHPTPTTTTHHQFFGEERVASVQSHFETSSTKTPLELVQEALCETPVNNPFTIHQVIFDTEKMELHISFDNSFAASSPQEILSLKDLFVVE